jgi:hypothetical protein
MFSWLDLIMPIGVSLVSIFFLGWGVLKADRIPAKITCVILILMFIAASVGWFVLRASGLKPVYFTEYNMGVVPGKVNTCPKDLINPAEVEAIAFWDKHYDRTCIAAAIPRVTLICKDEEAISTLTRLVRGYYNGVALVVGYNGKPSYTKSLYIHELSHHIVEQCGDGGSEDEQHALFKRVKLGY